MFGSEMYRQRRVSSMAACLTPGTSRTEPVREKRLGSPHPRLSPVVSAGTLAAAYGSPIGDLLIPSPARIESWFVDTTQLQARRLRQGSLGDSSRQGRRSFRAMVTTKAWWKRGRVADAEDSPPAGRVSP